TLSALTAVILTAGSAVAAGDDASIHAADFSFAGPLGKYDQNQLQRGLKVYTEVCSACHGVQYGPLRTLGDAGGHELPEDQVRAYSSQFEVFDP
ncbi:cytochrome c1, partial [Falsihalocynthiibacter sp. S25ZX9]|uniref:cytochrome c1 n=1 Tax=Falsihalocynthiibacter sp. S25ZX9 TaxID=3240870 RepID=UPI00350EED4C